MAVASDVQDDALLPRETSRIVGVSVQGRPLRTITVGHGPRHVLWIGGIHGDEREGRIATDELPEAFRRRAGAEDEVTLTVLVDANPDGSEMNLRGNANGVDLNRNFPAADFVEMRQFGQLALSQPESRAVQELVTRLEPHLVIVCHAWRGDHFINFDGPARHLAERFRQLSGYPVRESRDIAPTPGSLGSWVGRDLNIPILTLEFLRGRQPDAAWKETREAILAVILDA
jgi:murein peptide amidase A